MPSSAGPASAPSKSSDEARPVRPPRAGAARTCGERADERDADARGNVEAGASWVPRAGGCVPTAGAAGAPDIRRRTTGERACAPMMS